MTTNHKKKFKTIYITQPAHDFSALARYGDTVKFLMSGEESSLQEALKICAQNLLGFDPTTDALVIVGKVNGAFLAGVAIKELAKGKPVTISMGIYFSNPDTGAKDYKWESVTL